MGTASRVFSFGQFLRSPPPPRQNIKVKNHTVRNTCRPPAAAPTASAHSMPPVITGQHDATLCFSDLTSPATPLWFVFLSTRLSAFLPNRVLFVRVDLGGKFRRVLHVRTAAPINQPIRRSVGCVAALPEPL